MLDFSKVEVTEEQVAATEHEQAMVRYQTQVGVSAGIYIPASQLLTQKQIDAGKLQLIDRMWHLVYGDFLPILTELSRSVTGANNEQKRKRLLGKMAELLIFPSYREKVEEKTGTVIEADFKKGQTDERKTDS
jgi:hypothetical protein